MTVASAPTAIVIGASRILAPLGALLRERGFTTVAVARSAPPDMAGWDEVCAVDCHDPAAVSEWLDASHRAELLVAYEPAVGTDCWTLLAQAAEHVVVVAPSAWAAPDAPIPPWPVGATVVQLGWRASEPRWHSPQEIAQCVASAITFDERRLRLEPQALGAVSPWPDRPGAGAS